MAAGDDSPTGGGKDDPVPPALRSILNVDVRLSKKFVDGVERAFPVVASSTGTNYMKALEISCHGIPWFAGALVAIYLLRSQAAREVEVNLLFGLVYDVMMVAFLKALTRRARPSPNVHKDMFMTRGVDKFSFPSGHASRAVWVALFFTQWALPDMPIIFKILLYVWAASVTVSRALLRRHHLLDVAAGVLLGLGELFLSGILWVGPEACKALGDWIATSSEDESE